MMMKHLRIVYSVAPMATQGHWQGFSTGVFVLGAPSTTWQEVEKAAKFLSLHDDIKKKKKKELYKYAEETARLALKEELESKGPSTTEMDSPLLHDNEEEPVIISNMTGYRSYNINNAEVEEEKERGGW